MFNHGNFGGWDLGVQQYVRDAQEGITRANADRFRTSASLTAAAATPTTAKDGGVLEALQEEKLAAAASEDYERAAALKLRIADLEAANAAANAAANVATTGTAGTAAATTTTPAGGGGGASSASSGGEARYFKYSGAFVADVHSLLTKGGGLFGYPADGSAAEGKLRLLYESNPMAFLVEQAGGVASTGLERILDVQPHTVHQRIPTFLGSADDVYDLTCYMRYRLGPDMWI